MTDFILRGVGLIAIIVIVFAIVLRVVVGRRALRVSLMFLYRLMPLLVVGYCCVFFWHAFEASRVDCGERANGSVSGLARYGTNIVVSVSDWNLLKTGMSEIMTNRENIVREEHVSFRAELGTWLSIFGLLSILATIMVPVAAYKFQSMAGEDVRRKQASAVMNIRRDTEHLQNQIQDFKCDVLFMQASLCLTTVNNGPNAGLFRRGVGFLSDVLRCGESVQVDKGMSTINLLSRFYGHYGSLNTAARQEYIDAMKSFKWRFTMGDLERIFARCSEQEKEDYGKQYGCAYGVIRKMRQEFGK